ncbi:peroxidase-related enzyme [Microtetraspora sp. NBRC 16547]|uniref:carboxymuconolactone decarboxylase family protein n=1 Tax=Microtetraspora sp. NBRC 16547 TaxID=3030993 RepID=UPI0024A40A82|nr:peroxidase-related enzyme [Microtetraspora sp. NBRC 16547]GLW99083.1 carboxymuconolactone decarboxylase [Microtetraspora sp. NBRC 16547]
MPHISLNNDAPGIVGLMLYRPETGRLLNDLADVLMRGENTLSRGERELIATYVSRLNDCHFCGSIHGAVAAQQLPDGMPQVVQACVNPHAANVSPKMRALLDIAALVRESGRAVTEEAVSAAREHGATDMEIHDTVLIAAMFSMFNRYVDGLGTLAPPDQADYEPMAKTIVADGYAGAVHRFAG